MSTALGQSLDLIVPPEFRDAHWAGFSSAMETGTAEIDGGTTELPVRRADGEITVFSAAVTLLRNAQRRVIGAMVICTPSLASA